MKTKVLSLAQLHERIAAGKYPLRYCYSSHECASCAKDIALGEFYYDGGYGRRIHQSCVQKHAPTPAPPAADEAAP